MESNGNNVNVIWSPHPGRQVAYLRRREDVVLYGGSKGGGGKTDCLIADACMQIGKPGYKALLVRRTFPKLQEIIDRAHTRFPKMGAKWNGDLKRYTFPSGAFVEFGSCDSEIDKERYQGHEYAFIGFDQVEEFMESQFDYIRAQCRTTAENVQCYIRLTANPGSVGHWWVKRRFIDGKAPDVPCEIEFDHPFDKGKKLVMTYIFMPATQSDNPSLSESYLINLASIRNESERRAFMLGDWDAFSTDCVFDRDGMAFQDSRVEEPQWKGRLVDQGHSVEFQEDDKGELLIWRHPKPHSAYFIFADPAYGKTSGDFSPVGVFKYGTNELVALWWGRVDPTKLGSIVYGIGAYYGWAKVAVEVRPGPGIATVGKLVDLQYPHLYKHLKWDGQEHKETEEIGWVTDAVSRGEMISAGKEAIRSKEVILRSRIVLDECLNFIRHESGKEEARSECHDDCVIMFCGAMKCMSFDPVEGILDPVKNSRPMVITGGVKLPGRARDKRLGSARSGVLAGFK